MSYSQSAGTFEFRTVSEPILTDDNFIYYQTNTNIGTTFNGNVNSDWTYEETINNGHFEPFTAAVNTWTGSAFHPPALSYNHQNVLDTVSRNQNNDIELKSNLTIQNFLPPPPLPNLTQQITENHSSTSPTQENSAKIYSCHRCGKQYCRKSTLKAHVKHHLGERPFICQICGKTFSQAANLTAHRRVHTGEKPFSCNICLRPFSQSSSLVTHKRTHTGERPYPCNHCDKAFTDSSTLTKHLRTHTGQKPYGCPLCMMRFSQSGNLHRHLKTHRNENGKNHR